MSGGSLTPALRETLAHFDGSAPLTTAEVAEDIGIGRRSAYDRLARLTDRDRLATKRVGANGRVWWRPEGRRRARNERIVETVSDAIYVVDAEERFATVNPAAAELIGMDRESIVGEPVAAVIGEEAAARVLELGSSLEAGSDAVAIAELPIRTPDDDETIIEVRFSALPAEAGAAFVGVARDVTERVGHERELERYRTIVETIDDGVYTVDADGRFTFVNRAYEELIGRSREALVGAHVSSVVGDEVVRRANAFERDLRTGDRDRIKFEAPLEGPDGRTIHAEATFAIIPGTDGDYERVGAVRDVTERVARERALERQRERLVAHDALNGVFREITEAVIDRSTREEIETIVCDRLAGSDTFLGAWIGDVDARSETVTVRTWAGFEGDLDGVAIDVDPDRVDEFGPTIRAVRRRAVQVATDPETIDEGRWTGPGNAADVRAVAAIPIFDGDRLFGVLHVASVRSEAFDDDERAVVGQLGEVVGHAIGAAERKRALTSDEVVELEFRIRDVFEAVAVPTAADGPITLDRTVPLGDDDFLVYGGAAPSAIEAVETLVGDGGLPHWDSLTVIEERPDRVRFEVGLTSPPILSIVSDHGGDVREARIEGGDYYMRIHLAPSIPVRRVIDPIEAAYPTIELVTQHQRTRSARVALPAALGALTDRQRSAIEAAYRRGYFEWPRGSTGEGVASSMGVSPATFHQHLRTGQAKLLAAVFDGADDPAQPGQNSRQSSDRSR